MQEMRKTPDRTICLIFSMESHDEATDFSAYDQVQALLESSSDEDSVNRKRGDCLPGRLPVMIREHDIALERLYRLYYN